MESKKIPNANRITTFISKLYSTKNGWCLGLAIPFRFFAITNSNYKVLEKEIDTSIINDQNNKLKL